MSFKFYELVILILVVIGAGWAWIESPDSLWASFAALSLTATALVLFIVFAVSALKRSAVEDAIGTFQDGAHFAATVSKDAQKSLIGAMSLGARITEAQYRVLLQETRNGGHAEKAIAKMEDREHSFGVNLGKQLADLRFQLFKDAYSPADQYAEPDRGAPAPDDGWESMFVDSDYYDGGR